MTGNIGLAAARVWHRRELPQPRSCNAGAFPLVDESAGQASRAVDDPATM